MPILQKDALDAEEIRELLRRAVLWPRDQTNQSWIEESIWLDPAMSDLSGRVKLKLFPASRFFFKHLDSPRLRRTIVMKCAQSGFTENAIMYLMRRICERPVTTMWVGANAQKTEEDAKKRIWPAIENCPTVKPLCPPPEDRERWTKRLIMFDTMNLMIRGSESRMSMQGDPAGLLICDERREWKPGRIHMLRKRTRTKVHPLEISIGAAGKKDDELHTDWKDGSQTFLHFKCPHCGHDQPWRFGKKESVLFPDARALGGVVWPENDTTRPNGVWDFEAVKRETRYECEGCGHLFSNADKFALLEATYEHHRNPSALPQEYSLHVNALILPFFETTWGDIAVEFLKAVEEMRCGNIEPMVAFVCETLGEPWEMRNPKEKQSELLDRRGAYKMGELWPDPNGATVLILTFDRQLMKLVYVVRQWNRQGESRLIWCGENPSWDDLKAFILEKRIKTRCVWGDDGGRTTAEFRQRCLAEGWNVLKGEDYEHFSISEPGKESYRQGYRMTEFDPGVGTTQQGRAKMRAFLWSNPWYKDKLYNLFIQGKGPLWEIPQDIMTDYLKQVTGNEWREKTKSDGHIEGYWHENGVVDYADCELEQLVVADIGGLTRFLPKQKTVDKS